MTPTTLMEHKTRIKLKPKHKKKLRQKHRIRNILDHVIRIAKVIAMDKMPVLVMETSISISTE
jgi:hypothetical protein